jgi:hypothetical protein
VNEPTVPTDLQEALRQLVVVNQQIAHSLAELKKLYGEELLRREAERKELAAERAEWKEREKRAAAELPPGYVPVKPPLPWQFQLFWLLELQLLSQFREAATVLVQRGPFAQLTAYKKLATE